MDIFSLLRAVHARGMDRPGFLNSKSREVANKVTDPTLVDYLKKDTEAFDEWLNFNSLAARMLADGMNSFASFALWQFRTAFEEEETSNEIQVVVAAEWIQHARKEIYELGKLYVDLSDYEQRAFGPRARFRGDRGSRRSAETGGKRDSVRRRVAPITLLQRQLC